MNRTKLLWLSPLLGCAPALASGELLVSAFTSDNVVRYDSATGDVRGELGPTSLLNGPQGIAVGPDGQLYVCSEAVDRVLLFDGKSGDFIDTFIRSGNGLDGPTGVLFGPDGNSDGVGDVYIASFNTDTVLRYDGTNGEFIDVFVSAGDGGLNGPDAGMTYGPDGNLYLPSFWSNEILRYDAQSGAFIDEFVGPNEGGLVNPRTIIFRPSDGNMIVSSEGSNEVLLYDGTSGDFIGPLIPAVPSPTGMALGDDNDLFVCLVNSDAVNRYHVQTGAFIETIVPAGAGGIDAPVFVSFLDEASVPGDLDGDGDVDSADLAILLGAWGPCDDCDDCPGDLDKDCDVDSADLAILLGNWT